MNTLDPVTDRARILYAALSLRVFTAKELAVYSGVKRNTVQMQLRRDAKWFEFVGKIATGRRGYPAKRYRLREEACAELQQASSMLIEQVGPLPGESETDIASTTNSERFETVLRALTKAVQRASALEMPDPERAKLVRRARFQFEDAQDALRLFPSKDKDARLMVVSRQLDALDPERQPRIEIPATLAHWVQRVKTVFTEWPAEMEIVVPAQHTELTPELLQQAIDLTPETGPVTFDSLIAPAARTCEMLGGRLDTAPVFLTEEINKRLEMSARRRDFRTLCSTACIAALFDLDWPIGALFNTLIENPARHDDFNGLTRRVMCYAIAHTARPGDRPHSLIASKYATILLTDSQTPDDVAILTPAALRLEGNHGDYLLSTLASSLYWNDASPQPDLSEPLHERELVKNLIVALQEHRFEPFVQAWTSLAHERSGRKLIAALVNESYGCLSLHDDHRLQFAFDDGQSRRTLPLIGPEEAEAIQPLICPYNPGFGGFSALVTARGEAELRKWAAAA